MRTLPFLAASLVLLFIFFTTGCLSLAGFPADQSDLTSSGAGGSLVGSGGSAIAIAVNQNDITTSPEAKELFMKGLTLSTQQARYNASLEYFDRALALDQNFTAAWYAKGVALHNMKQYDEAILCYDRALAIDPGDAGAWSLKATTLRDMGRLNESAECFRKAHELDPRYAVG